MSAESLSDNEVFSNDTDSEENSNKTAIQSDTANNNNTELTDSTKMDFAPNTETDLTDTFETTTEIEESTEKTREISKTVLQIDGLDLMTLLSKLKKENRNYTLQIITS